MVKRFSKKRQSIIQCLQETDEHPSAEWVYNKLKPQYPDLSLGTVYRNINQLVAEGLVRSVGIVDDKERFDARITQHNHAICIRCGKIIDIDVVLPQGLTAQAQSRTGFVITAARLQFEGLCAECARMEKSLTP